MISCRVARSPALRVLLSCQCAYACVIWNGSASAQNSEVEPAWPAPSASVADRPNKAEPGHPSTRTDHVRLGALFSAGFPRPLAVEGVVKIERLVALGIEYSTLPGATVSDVHFGASAIAGSARVFPLRGPFFLGLRAGRQRVSADAVVSGYGYTVPVTLAVDTIFINPQIGLLWTWDPGITIGIDAGLQIPLKSDTSSTVVNSSMSSTVQQAISPAQQRLENVAGAVGQTVLPTVDLLKVGMLF